MKKYLAIALLIFITSCVETVVIGTATTAIIIVQNKSITDTKNDLLITAQIDKKFLANGLKNPDNKIGVTVEGQRVLLTGVVDDDKMVKKANDLAWKVSGVMEVIDEIQVIENKSLISNFTNYFRDVLITAQIRTKAALDKNISSVNFEVITVNKIVYLIGTAQNAGEIKAIGDISAKTIWVDKVISHIILAKNLSV